MIEIDGGYGSGGGQIIRTALGLSVLTGKACKISKVRAKRKEKGLKEQHLQAVNALAALCDAKVEGAELGSNRITFSPGKIKEDSLEVKIATAGSIGLVLQALLIPTTKANLLVHIKGGATYGKWAPPLAYISNVLGIFLEKMSYSYDINIVREGFYPVGGAIVNVKTSKAQLKPLTVLEKGDIKSVEGISVASEFLRKAKVAERQAKSAAQLLYKELKVKPVIDIKYSKSMCPGSGMQLWIKTANSILGASGLGEKGKPAEQVGSEAAKQLLWEYRKGAVDSRAADQLLPYMAISASGKIAVSKVTDHAKTNAYVIEKFLPVRFYIKDKTIEVKSK